MKKYDIKNPKIETKEICELDKVVCDKCGKIIYDRSKDIGFADGQDYVQISTWHERWGNDSCESHDGYEMCKECAIKFVTEYIKEATSTDHLELVYDVPDIYQTVEYTEVKPKMR